MAWWFRRRQPDYVRVTGPGAVVAVDNQDITSHEAFQGNVRSAYQGGASRSCGRGGGADRGKRQCGGPEGRLGSMEAR